MVTPVSTPSLTDMDEIVAALSGWQRSGGPVQLHPGDLGWASLPGAEALAAHLRVWRHDDALAAVGMLDGSDLVRLALAPEHDDNTALADQIAADLADAGAGVLPAGPAAVEARAGSALRALLPARGWALDDPWVPLRLVLTDDLPDLAAEVGLVVEQVTPDNAGEWAAVHAAAFSGRVLDFWPAMSTSLPFRQGASCLLGRDDRGLPAACITVWSAGVSRPGVVEPMGVHPEHRRRGFGRAITVAGAHALRDLGSSEATVCTPHTQEGAVETYLAAGFTAEEPVCDFVRS